MHIASAAVADYRPSQRAAQKLKKHAEVLNLELVRTQDILGALAELPNRPFTVGFAAETDHLLDYARDKLQRKKLDMIAANLVGPGRLGFDTADNALLVLWEDGGTELPVLPKPELAGRLVSLITERMHAQTAAEDS